MAEVITVRLEDCHRRPNARQLDKAHVAELVESMKLVGWKPSKSMELREDGPGFYWIIDGGHRHAAAVSAGLTEGFGTLEQFDDEAVLVSEGVSNLSRPDTEQEKYARAQQFFALGVNDDHAIEVATGIKPEVQHKVRSVYKKLNDETAAEDTTLDQALAAYEFVDDEETFKSIMNAGSGWRMVYDGVIRSAKLEESRLRAMALIEGAGCTFVSADKADALEGVQYLSRTYDDKNDAAPKGATHAKLDCYGSYYSVVWYGVRADAKETAAEAAEREAAEQVKAQWNAGKAEARESRFTWLRARLSDIIPNSLVDVLAKLITGHLSDIYFELDVDDNSALCELLGIEEVGALTPSMSALVGKLLIELDDICFGRNCYFNVNGVNMDDAKMVAAYGDALAAAGYPLTEWESAELKSAKDALLAAELAVAQAKIADEGGE